ncbi:FGGY-family carbohydrate kinase [Oscillospiraceae bacterium MB08-C2-2]|nr:FGGY-family carbohydrate kinase [Oscillospiraceae bacterium MB08-C2-2]
MAANAKQHIEAGQTSLGIELGSTRIKAVLIDWNGTPLASGSFDWENQLINGMWTYSMDDVWNGLRHCYADLAEDVQKQYSTALSQIGSMGISAMMHGYLPFDCEGKQLAAFRTWRNTTTEQAAEQLTKAFAFNIPLRWSIAHLHQVVLDGEEHVAELSYLTTLAGYVHWQLTGEKVLGIGDASGMFPVDDATGGYSASMVDTYDRILAERGYSFKLEQVLPRVLTAGQSGGALTDAGARLLDPSGSLRAGIPFCPPEGDAGTGMVATNSVSSGTGNVSAGTSIFAMLVLDGPLSRMYPEIDLVATPAGRNVAMVHANNCTGDLDAWIKLFRQVLDLSGAQISKPRLYDLLYETALQGDPDCGGLLSYNYYSGEPITALEEGRPLFARLPDAAFNLPNFMRSILFSTMAVLRIGMDILTEQEKVRLTRMMGHGGLFKTERVGQQLMAGALNAPVAVMSGASEGGAWGIALLAAYLASGHASALPLEQYLQEQIFADTQVTCVEPMERDVQGFAEYLLRYRQGLAVQSAAVKHIR